MLNKKISEIKLILLGDSGVGKTSIINKYIYDEFDENIESSIAVCYASKIIEINKQKIKLNIWDTMGQEKFRSISKIFLNDTKVVILVYSIISEESFKSLDYWINLYENQFEEGTILGVAGNKTDLYLDQEVPNEFGVEYAEKKNAIFGLISAKNKESIDKYMEELVKAYLNKKEVNKTHDSITITLNSLNNNHHFSCCSVNQTKVRQRNNDYILKEMNGAITSVFLGEKGVGKTSIIKRIKGKGISIDEPHTEQNKKYLIYHNSKIKFIIYDSNIDNMKTREFINILQKSNIFFLVYDIKDKQSLERIGFLIEAIRKCKETLKKEPYLLYIIGNKNDISYKNSNFNEEESKNKILINNDTNNKIYIEKGKELCNNHNGIFKLVSAKDNKGIQNIIENAIEKYLGLPNIC